MSITCRNFAAALIVASLLLVGPPAGIAQDLALGAGERAVQSTLSFGMNSKDGSGVSEQEWAGFLQKVVTPRFPDGFTVLTGYGQWRNGSSQKIVIEASRVLILTHVDNRRVAEKIKEIKAAYIRQFKQDAVFHTRTAIEIVP
jgi:hypothetical protein